MRDGVEVRRACLRQASFARELGRQGSDAGQRRLEVVRDAAQEVGLDAGHAMELVRLAWTCA